MAKYKVKAQSFINDTLVAAGSEIEFAGEPGDNLEPLDDAAKVAVEAAALRREQKAVAIAAGASGVMNKDTADQLASIISQLSIVAGNVAGLSARVDALQAVATPDLSKFAAASDVAELDAGLQLVAGRVDEVEGTLAALAAKAPAPPAPQPPADPPVT